MFNTGDLGRWIEDGTLEHRGRIDHQVKIKVLDTLLFIFSLDSNDLQGFRVELDGVSAAIEVS